MRKYLYLVLSSCLFISCESGSNTSKLSNRDSLLSKFKDSTDYLIEKTKVVSISYELLDTASPCQLQNYIQQAISSKFQVTETSDTLDYRREFLRLNTQQQVVYSTIVLENNVALIGFLGYFEAYTSVGQFAAIAVESYQKMGLFELGKIVQEAINIRMKKSDFEENDFYQIDSMFKATAVKKNPMMRRYKYIQENKDSFLSNTF